MIRNAEYNVEKETTTLRKATEPQSLRLNSKLIQATKLNPLKFLLAVFVKFLVKTRNNVPHVQHDKGTCEKK